MVKLALEVVIITHVFMSRARCLAPILFKIVIYEQIVIENSQHPYLRTSFRWEKSHSLRKDGQTYMIKQADFRNCFANAPKN